MAYRVETDFLVCNVLFPVELFFQVMKIEIALYKNVLKGVIGNLPMQDNVNSYYVELTRILKPRVLVFYTNVVTTGFILDFFIINLLLCYLSDDKMQTGSGSLGSVTLDRL